MFSSHLYDWCSLVLIIPLGSIKFATAFHNKYFGRSRQNSDALDRETTVTTPRRQCQGDDLTVKSRCRITQLQDKGQLKSSSNYIEQTKCVENRQSLLSVQQFFSHAPQSRRRGGPGTGRGSVTPAIPKIMYFILSAHNNSAYFLPSNFRSKKSESRVGSSLGSCP